MRRIFYIFLILCMIACGEDTNYGGNKINIPLSVEALKGSTAIISQLGDISYLKDDDNPVILKFRLK